MTRNEQKMSRIRRYFPFLATQKNRYYVGGSLTGIILATVNFLVLVKVFQPTFEMYGIPYQTLYIMLPVGFVFINWFIGWCYERSGLWRFEWEHQIKTQNPEYLPMLKNVAIIKADLAKLVADLDALGVSQHTVYDEKEG